MGRTIRSFFVVVCAGAAAAACSDSTAPVIATGDRWALVSIDGVALPAAPAAISSSWKVLADTLQFGASSTMWKPTPLAVGKRVIRRGDGSVDFEEWWYTYDSGEPLPSPFSIRLLCSDGDTALADCIDGRGEARLEGSTLTLTFNVSQFGVLRYQRVPAAFPD